MGCRVEGEMLEGDPHCCPPGWLAVSLQGCGPDVLALTLLLQRKCIHTQSTCLLFQGGCLLGVNSIKLC